MSCCVGAANGAPTLDESRPDERGLPATSRPGIVLWFAKVGL